MARSTHLSLLQTDGVEAQVYFGFLHRPTVFGPMTLSITPSVMADHAKGEGHKNPKAIKAKSDGNGWERRGAYEYRVYGVHDERPPGWSQDNKTGGVTADCLQDKPRSTAVELTFLRAVATTTMRTREAAL